MSRFFVRCKRKNRRFRATEAPGKQTGGLYSAEAGRKPLAEG